MASCFSVMTACLGNGTGAGADFVGLADAAPFAAGLAAIVAFGFAAGVEGVVFLAVVVSSTICSPEETRPIAWRKGTERLDA
jgi:hypothetical protein